MRGEVGLVMAGLHKEALCFYRFRLLSLRVRLLCGGGVCVGYFLSFILLHFCVFSSVGLFVCLCVLVG